MTISGAGEAALTTSELHAAMTVLDQNFTSEERQDMQVEDSLTWRNVVALLVSVVSTGVIMMILTVLWVGWMAS